MNKWFQTTGLKLYIGKSKVINFKTVARHCDEFQIPYSPNLAMVKSSKILGIYVNDNMKLNDHIKYISRKLSKPCFNMSCIAKITSMEVRKTVYFSYFQ